MCRRHRYWIGPPDYGRAATALHDGGYSEGGDGVTEVVRAQRGHCLLVRRFGTGASFDAVLTGFVICGHLWTSPRHARVAACDWWSRRADWLIPRGRELVEFSASRLFAAVYPEAVSLAGLVADPAWRQQARDTPSEQRAFLREAGRRLGSPYCQPVPGGDPIGHWMAVDSRHPHSRPAAVFPDTRASRATRLDLTSTVGVWRTERGATWFAVNRRGGTTLLHHRHLRPVLIRDWSPSMDGITAAIWASQANPSPTQRPITPADAPPP